MLHLFTHIDDHLRREMKRFTKKEEDLKDRGDEEVEDENAIIGFEKLGAKVSVSKRD